MHPVKAKVDECYSVPLGTGSASLALFQGSRHKHIIDSLDRVQSPNSSSHFPATSTDGMAHLCLSEYAPLIYLKLYVGLICKDNPAGGWGVDHKANQASGMSIKFNIDGQYVRDRVSSSYKRPVDRRS